jgi:hypothetical protein
MDFQSPETTIESNTEAKTNTLKVSLPFSVTDYFALLDWTGRQFREGKPGYLAEHVPPLVKEINLNPSHWVTTVEQSSIRDQSILGTLSQMKAWAKKIGKDWLKGQKITLLKYLTT